jgi:hypothetical protein
MCDLAPPAAPDSRPALFGTALRVIYTLCSRFLLHCESVRAELYSGLWSWPLAQIISSPLYTHVAHIPPPHVSIYNLSILPQLAIYTVSSSYLYWEPTTHCTDAVCTNHSLHCCRLHQPLTALMPCAPTTHCTAAVCTNHSLH